MKYKCSKHINYKIDNIILMTKRRTKYEVCLRSILNMETLIGLNKKGLAIIYLKTQYLFLHTATILLSFKYTLKQDTGNKGYMV